MTTYMKRFVYASLFYLGLATIIGILDGTMDLGYIGSFAHTHFSLLGFMAMIVFGIGYFILPRFNASDLRWENWVPIHFWSANFSLIGMIVFRGLYVETGNSLYNVGFVVAASIQVISIFMFVINIWVTLSPPKEAVKPAAPTVAQPAIEVNAETKVADLVDRIPSLKDVLIKEGLRPLEMPGHIDKVRAMGVTLGTAARNHDLQLDRLITAIHNEIGSTGNGDAMQSQSANGSRISASTLIGHVLKEHPQTRAVFQKHFGSGCFDCPGQAFESVDMACRMHGVDTDTFLSEVQRLAK